jgi:uncharacterized delta-60 repeat protein
MRNTKTYRLISAPILALLALLLFGSTTITAAPGDLDLSFGNGGIVVTSFAGQYNYDSAQTVRVQPDGKIVVCGQIYDDDFNDESFFIARYHPTGALDASFGTNGKIIGPLYSGAMVGNDIALQPDGKISTVGGVFLAGWEFAVHRYNANGTLDASFGAGGVVITPIGEFAIARSVAIQADGKIVVAGNSNSAGQGYQDFTVVRLLPDGSPDTSFNGTGKVITSFGNESIARRVFLQPDGKIVAVGEALVGNDAFALVRYNADGTLDSGFGVGGKVIHAVGIINFGDAALQPDGKIVASGGFSAPSSNYSYSEKIVRCNPNGSLDTSFAANGIFTTAPPFHVGYGIALQPDGKLVAFGLDGYHGNYRFAILRLNPNGAPDTGFGTNGRVITPMNSSSFALDGAVQPDGKILAFGMTFQPDFINDIVIARYLGDSVACPNPIDCPDIFVRQQYQDFLNRETDAGGLAYWTSRITECGSDAHCIHERRIGVSAAFFIELEFQDTGYFVYRFYKASFGRQPNYSEFTSDRAKVIGGANLEASKQAFADEWVQRPAFGAAHPITLSNTEVVNKLFDSAGLTASRYDAQRQQEIQAMNAGRSRALVLRDVIEIADFKNIPDPNDPRYTELKQISQYNPAFVLMQYFGYLRRNVDQNGYNFWLDIVNNREPNNYRAMVCAFITSSEYQLRFGTAVTRSNADCGP